VHEAADGEGQASDAEATQPATVAQCHEGIALLGQQVVLLQEQMAELQARNARLQEQLKLNSRNSSKPPSSDGAGARNRAQRCASQRKRGAQKGHPGNYWAVLPQEQVHAVVECAPPALSVSVQPWHPGRASPQGDEARSGVSAGAASDEEVALRCGCSGGSAAV
jgi:hypothetical protein